MLDEDLALRALDLAMSLGADFAEVRIQIDEEESTYMRNGIVEAYGISMTGGISVRILKNGSFGFASTDTLEPDQVEAIVRRAIKLAESQGKGNITLSEEPNYSVKYELIPKKDPFEVSLEEKIGLLSEIDKALLGLGDEVKVPFRNISVGAWRTHKYYVNSEGTSVRSSVSRLTVSAYYVLSYKARTMTRHISMGGAVGWEGIDIWRPVEAFRKDAEALRNVILRARTLNPGKYDVVMGTEVSGLATHESCGHPFELDRIMGREGAQAGESYAKIELLGTRIARDVVTIIDDPTLPNSYGFYLYDDEGVRARPRYLIYKGVVNEFLMNREYAAKLGMQSNAAARASSYNREPIVRMANTYIAPGDYTFEELIEDIKKGIYIKTFGEWNIDDRRYNQRYVGQEAYIIEGGELGDPVWRPILEITTPSYYRSIDAVDKNLEFQPATCGKGDPGQGVPVYTGGPNIRLRRVGMMFGE